MWIQLFCMLHALVVLAVADAPAEASFSVQGSDLHLVTPDGLGSLIIDGVVDVKKMNGMFNQLWGIMLGLVSDVKTLNSTILELQVHQQSVVEFASLCIGRECRC